MGFVEGPRSIPKFVSWGKRTRVVKTDDAGGSDRLNHPTETTHQTCEGDRPVDRRRHRESGRRLG
ncbi:hypothetical protein ASG43_08655 [Aureimonas sp. Leaf454]|nr:hypothetical protein ASG43_08655 [Aureimonas sp. Leaf454]